MTIHLSDALVTLAVPDLEVSSHFYQQLLARKPQPYTLGVYAEFQVADRLRLGIFQPKVPDQAEFANSQGSGMSLCLEVDDLEGAIAHLSSLGYPPPGEIVTASHGREIYAYDPTGNRLILHQSHQF